MTRKKKPRLKPLRYFFYHGDLHLKIHIHRPNDVIIAWNYPKGTAERYVYSDVRRNGRQAFNTKQVQQMVNRGRLTLMAAIKDGNIHRPSITYGLDEKRNEFAYWWSEENVMELRDYLATVHYGRPRKDGMVTPRELPTAAELRALMRQGTVFYVKEGDEFVPTWRADNL